ncbi:hypothetical protein F2P79_009379 [Pimephales promelas]|nr:hypothetical protein F2P79_009379 [Pimephales promelas]
MSSWVGTGPVYHGAQSCSCPERAALPNHMKWFCLSVGLSRSFSFREPLEFRQTKLAVQHPSVHRMAPKRRVKACGNSLESSVWYQFYICEHAKKKKANQEGHMMRDLGLVGLQERPKGYWRNTFFKEIAGLNVNKWRKKLQRIDPYSGLPRHTEEVLRSLCITWEITVTDGRGRRSTFEQSHAFFSSTGVFVFWGAVSWPSFNQLTSLELCGVSQVPLHCPAPYRPGWKTVMSKIKLQGEHSELCVADKIVKMLYVGQGVTLGFWQDQCGIAFVIVNLHNHRLVERSLHVSNNPCAATGVSALFDDVDPEYGLHGYTAYIELHNTARVVMSDRFSQLFCRRDQISDGYLPLEVISENNGSLNTHLVEDVSLPWRTEALHGTIKR